VSKLFDVTDSSGIEETLHTEATQIKVQFGKGIAGTVALTKQPINIKDAYEVSVFEMSTTMTGIDMTFKVGSHEPCSRPVFTGREHGP